MAATAKRIFLLIFLLILISVSVNAEMVINQTICNTITNNLGTTQNIYGQSFTLNTTAAGTHNITAVLYLKNVSTAPLPAGTGYNFSIHYNESVNESTVIPSCTITNRIPSIASAASTCGSGTNFSVTFPAGCLLNQSGNYTVALQLTTEGTAQFYEHAQNTNPYTNGKCWNCNTHAPQFAFDETSDAVFRIYADASAVGFFTITALDTTTGASLTTFNATVNGTVFTAVAGTATTTFPTNSGNVSVFVNATNYLTNSSTVYNTSTNYIGNLTPFFAVNNVRDEYTNVAISDFNVTVQNNTGNFSFSTTTGALYTTLINGQIVNLTLQRYDYLNKTYSVNTSSNFTTGTIHQVEDYITARSSVSGLVITNFSVRTNQKTWGTNTGLLFINITSGAQPMNFSATSYAINSTTLTYSTSPLNTSSTVYLNPNVTVNLFNESNGAPFHPNSTNGTVLRVFCPTTTLEFTLTSNSSNNIITCAWTSMRMYVTLNNVTYFRTLIPAYSTLTINWYLINLAEKTAVQKIFTLNDLASQYGSGTFIVDKILNGSQVRIHNETWDIEQKVIAYFILYDSYILQLTDNQNVTRSLGMFIADTSASHTITVPIISFAPENVFDDFNYGYLSERPNNIGNGWIYMQYGSTNGTLTNVTWVIYNASNTSQVFYNTTFVTTNGSANFTPMLNGTVYISLLTYNHSSYSVHTDKKTWGSILLAGLDSLAGFQNPVAFKKWFSIIVTTSTVLLFSGLTAGIGAVAGVTVLTLFVWIGWITFTLGLLAFFGLLAFIIMMRGEGVR